MPVSNHTRNLSLSAARNKRSRDKKRQAGLCIRCGKESIRIRCDECREAVNEETNQRRAKLAQDGRCPGCGEPNDTDGYRCSDCNAKQRRAYKKRYTKKVEIGTCSTCSEPVDDGRRFCKRCLLRMKVAREKWIEEGRCCVCGRESELSNQSLRHGEGRRNYCKVCWLKTLANRVLGSIKHWKVLVDKLDACNWRCPYTGEMLVIGENLSFDHIDPVSRFPEKRYDPENVEPVSWQANMAKSGLTKSEFLALVEKIHLHATVRRYADDGQSP